MTVSFDQYSAMFAYNKFVALKRFVPLYEPKHVGKRERNSVLNKLASSPMTNSRSDYGQWLRSLQPDHDAPIANDLVTEAYDPRAICGYCGRMASQHPYIASNSLDSCKIDAKWIGSATHSINPMNDGPTTTEKGDLLPYGPVEHLDRYGMPKVDFADSSSERDLSDHWAAILDDPAQSVTYGSSRMPDDLQWKDDDPECVTVTIDQYRKGLRPKNKAGDIQRSVFVEGDAGFLTVEVYDQETTERYSKRLLNVYTKNHRLNVGRVEIQNNTDGTITAVCRQYGCGCKTPIDPNTATREEMEEFTLATIRHGNNHTADFIRDRADWYKIHSYYCDTNCNGRQAHCAYENIRVPFASPQKAAITASKIAASYSEPASEKDLEILLSLNARN